MSERHHKYIFGPVPSRRLGRSLGVDLVPHKVCSYNCIYCQVGPTTKCTLTRDEYVPTAEVLAELAQVLAAGCDCDYVTLSGSGEPTLHRDVGRIIAAIRDLTDVPVAVLTNGSLLYDPGVRQDLMRADLVVPSLDAADPETFEKINRPCPDLSFETMVAGLEAFSAEYGGSIRLEVLLAAGINDSDEHVARLKAIIDRIDPDRIDLNTVTRPPAEDYALPVAREGLEHIRDMLGPKAEIIARFRSETDAPTSVTAEQILDVLRRRPCTLEDLIAGLNCQRWEAAELLGQLTRTKAVGLRQQAGKVYYQVAGGGSEG
ncbi:MAG: radical SAM protein [Planctomycetota bacterium]